MKGKDLVRCLAMPLAIIGVMGVITNIDSYNRTMDRINKDGFEKICDKRGTDYNFLLSSAHYIFRKPGKELACYVGRNKQ